MTPGKLFLKKSGNGIQKLNLRRYIKTDMNFAGHATGGALAALTVGGATFAFGFKTTMLAAGCAWIGAVVPDLDTGSIPARWFGRLGFAGSCLLLGSGIIAESFVLLVSSAVPGLLALFLLGLKHRGPLHKYWLPAFLIPFAVWGQFPNEFVRPLMFSFAGGICVHLLLDGIFPWSFKGWIL
jgi:membrane-bound metal-dependent hydrolase YbcI (DUF457 family)